MLPLPRYQLKLTVSVRELAKAVEPHVKQEDEGKYRCKTCNKLFKANAFVQKHIATKHGELVKSLDEVRLNDSCYLFIG